MPGQQATGRGWKGGGHRTSEILGKHLYSEIQRPYGSETQRPMEQRKNTTHIYPRGQKQEGWLRQSTRRGNGGWHTALPLAHSNIRAC